jgi:hypothetical protein
LVCVRAAAVGVLVALGDAVAVDAIVTAAGYTRAKPGAAPILDRTKQAVIADTCTVR